MRSVLISIILLFGLLIPDLAHADTPLTADRALADLDGDGIRDSVSSTLSPSRHTYFVNVSLSRDRSSSFLQADAALPLDFHLLFSDIDRDGDSDLLLVEGSDLPVAAWSNDGAGRLLPKPGWEVSYSLRRSIRSGFSLPLTTDPCPETSTARPHPVLVSRKPVLYAQEILSGLPGSALVRPVLRFLHQAMLRSPPAGLFT